MDENLEFRTMIQYFMYLVLFIHSIVWCNQLYETNKCNLSQKDQSDLENDSCDLDLFFYQKEPYSTFDQISNNFINLPSKSLHIIHLYFSSIPGYLDLDPSLTRLKLNSESEYCKPIGEFEWKSTTNRKQELGLICDPIRLMHTCRILIFISNKKKSKVQCLCIEILTSNGVKDVTAYYSTFEMKKVNKNLLNTKWILTKQGDIT